MEDVARSRMFYVDVLGAELFREYGGDSAVLRFHAAGRDRVIPRVVWNSCKPVAIVVKF